MNITPKISNHNFKAFLWHAAFLAFAQNFMDVDTVMPAMVVETGGNAIHVGILTAIMMGGSSLTQLFFAPYISNKAYKKKFLLIGINLRVIALIALGTILFITVYRASANILGFIFLFITVFSVSGAFATISYTDILGKSIVDNKRKTFFSAKQIIAGTIVLFSAFLAKKILANSSYPANYAYMFMTGGILLLIASGGFWMVNESVPSVLKIRGFKSFFAIMRSELANNRRLAYFLGFINTQGIAVSFLPFVMLYAKKTFHSTSTDTGLFLLFKVIGIFLVGMTGLIAAKKIKYRVLLYGNVLLSLVMAIIVFNTNNISTLKYLFVMGGIVYSLYSITMNGLLLEVSGNENRALYAGFAGAGNILPAIFPLTAGWIISSFGFNAFLFIFIVVIASALYFIYKVDCRK